MGCSSSKVGPAPAISLHPVDPTQRLERAVQARRDATEAETVSAKRERRASDQKEQGNAAYKAGEYRRAVTLYRDAIKWLPLPRLTAVCRSNESAALGALGGGFSSVACFFGVDRPL